MSKVLVIVDVQKQFKDFMQSDLVDELSKYAETFDKVYQIWDTHNGAYGPTHSFPKQVDSVPKRFGKSGFSDKVMKFIKSIEDSTENGKVFSLTDDEGYIVRVKNNHDWFYVNPEIVKLINEIKGDEVILVGGADNECLTDVLVSFESFDINVVKNDKYVYDAKTTPKDSVKESFRLLKYSEFRKR